MNPAPPSFLDSFPKEILDNVLRFFSRLPRADDWVPHIPLESIIELYGVTGELGKLMKPRFNTLCVSNTFKYNSERVIFEWKKRKGPMLWTKDLDVARRFVLAGGGQSLSTIIVGEGMYTDDLGAEISDDFLSNCPNVKSLSIEDKKGHWVSRFGGQLEHLDISTESSAAFAKYCTNLRELNLYLEDDLVEDAMETDVADLWERIGGNLECLTLTCMHREVEHIENIPMHCRNLRRICIYESKRFNQELSGLLASYGDQLEYCHMDNMNESQLSAVSKACKNARFSAGIRRTNLIYPTLKVLGRQLDKVFLVSPRGPLDAGELAIAWNACHNIRELEVHGCGIEDAKAIVATPKKHVESMYISSLLEAEENEVKKVLDIFSEGTVGVERIQYEGTRLSGEAFEKLISRNKSSLQEFEVDFIGRISSEKMDTYLPVFLKCPKLEVVCSRQISRNMLETLNRRGIQYQSSYGNPRYDQ